MSVEGAEGKHICELVCDELSNIDLGGSECTVALTGDSVLNVEFGGVDVGGVALNPGGDAGITRSREGALNPHGSVVLKELLALALAVR